MESEEGSAVVEEIEFDIAAPAVELPRPFPLAEGSVFSFLDNGLVGLPKGIADGAHECEAPIKTGLTEVVEEEPTDAPGLISVSEVKIGVAAVLEF